MSSQIQAAQPSSSPSRYGKITPTHGASAVVGETIKIEKAKQLNSNILPHSDKAGDDYWMGDMYDGFEKRECWRLDDGKPRPYLEHLRKVSEGWPHIRWLADFMEVGTSPNKWRFMKDSDISDRAKRTRVAVLDFSNTPIPPTRQDIHSSPKLSSYLTTSPDPSHARIFIVEDLSRDAIEAFGTKFDIDPNYFRGHVNDYLWFQTNDPWTELSELEHVSRERTFWNFRYMRPRHFGGKGAIECAVEEMGGWNVLRRLEQDLSYRIRKLRPSKDAPVGVLRTKASLWVRKNKAGESGTVAILIVDPTPVSGSPLWHGPRTYQPCPSMNSSIPTSPPRTSHFEDVIHYTSTLINPQNLRDSREVAVPILTVIASEWLSVLAYITTSLIKMEYALEHPDYRDTSQSLDFVLDRLHPLRRLIPVYHNFLSEILSSILSVPPLSSAHMQTLSPALACLRLDYLSILSKLDRLEARSSSIISLATALISVEENKRAMKMNTNLVRVTYLAVVFVPMAFVSSFFSMTPDLSELETTIWIYFLVAVPLTALCLAIADPRRVRKAFWWCVGRSTGKEEYVSRGIHGRQRP